MEKRSMGKFIAALRRENGWTQSELAEKLFVSDKAVSRWERDESMPDITLVPLLADVFGVTADDLLRGERKDFPTQTQTEKKEDAENVSDDAGGVAQKQNKERMQQALKQRLLRVKALSFVSLAIVLFCLILAAIFLLAIEAKKVNEAVLGGCVAVGGVWIAAIYQICITYAFVCVGDTHETLMKLFNGKLANTVKTYFMILLFCFGGAILIFYAQSKPEDMDNGNYNFMLICLAVLTGFVFAFGGYLLYRFAIEKSLLKKRKIVLEERQADVQKLKNRYTVPCVLIATACIALCVVSLFFLSDFHFARAHVFDNKEDFVAYMERTDSPEDHPKPDGETPSHGGSCSYDDFYFQYLTKKGRWIEIEASYPNETIIFYASNASVKGYVFKDFANGELFPIRVYEEKDYRAGGILRWITVGVSPVLAVADIVVTKKLYDKKRKKIV
ncbi:MAG: helix-turn-helix transcriptional regulator [Clostridia bacterium]|nr:helix-turn-helix transcriptional regulator [Clostridia bacterium]